LDLYPAHSLKSTQLLFVNFGHEEVLSLMPVLSTIRAAGIRTELYPEASKLKKQLGYADAKKIPYVALVGENEMTSNQINLKNMLSGAQQLVTTGKLIEILSQ